MNSVHADADRGSLPRSHRTDEDDDGKSVGVSKAMMSYLMTQISFLHRELERVELQLSCARNEESGKVAKLSSQFHVELRRKMDELRASRVKLASCEAKMRDYEQEVEALNRRLAAMQSGTSTLSLEKSVLLKKLFKALRTRSSPLRLEGLPVDAPERGESVVADDTQCGSGASAEDTTLMLRSIEALTEERENLRELVARLTRSASGRRCDAATGTDGDARRCDACVCTDGVSVESKECQADSAANGGDEICADDMYSYSRLVSLLKTKVAECDNLRIQADHVGEAYRELEASSSATRVRLEEETEQRKLVEARAERLAEQVRELQREVSAQAANEAQMRASVDQLETQKTLVHAEFQKLERIRHAWEAEVQRYEGDISVLQANKNYAAEQMSTLASECERWQSEVQHSRQTEAQLKLALSVKETENADLMLAYQQCAKENEAFVDAQRCAQRDVKELQSTLSSRESTILYLQEQIKELHDREQQLLIDNQTLEFANGQMHQRIIQCDSRCEQLEGECTQLRQSLDAKAVLTEELQQELMECNKHIALKDNEITLLHQSRIAYDQIASELRASLSTEQIKCRALERSNAQLLSRDILISTQNYPMRTPSSSVVAQPEEHLDTQGGDTPEKTALHEQLQHERNRCESLEKQLSIAEKEMILMAESKERLHGIVMQQTEALSRVADGS